MGLDTVELIVKIEEIFRINIPDREAEKINTVGDIYDIVWNYISSRYTGTEEELNLKRAETEEMLQKIIADQAGFEPSEIERHHSITSDLGMD